MVHNKSVIGTGRWEKWSETLLSDLALTVEMVQKALEAKLVRKAQRQAALDEARMAKRERG